MTPRTLPFLVLVAGCEPATHEDTVDASCAEASRQPYSEAESEVDTTLSGYVDLYAALDGAWTADFACVSGESGTLEVSISPAAESEMEVVTYEGTCGVSVGVVAETQTVLDDSEVVSVPSVALDTSISDGGGWGVVVMSGEASNGTTVLIEVAAGGEIRGSTMSSELSGSDQETLECDLTNWRR